MTFNLTDSNDMVVNSLSLIEKTQVIDVKTLFLSKLDASDQPLVILTIGPRGREEHLLAPLDVGHAEHEREGGSVSSGRLRLIQQAAARAAQVLASPLLLPFVVVAEPQAVAEATAEADRDPIRNVCEVLCLGRGKEVTLDRASVAGVLCRVLAVLEVLLGQAVVNLQQLLALVDHRDSEGNRGTPDAAVGEVPHQHRRGPRELLEEQLADRVEVGTPDVLHTLPQGVRTVGPSLLRLLLEDLGRQPRARLAVAPHLALPRCTTPARAALDEPEIRSVVAVDTALGTLELALHSAVAVAVAVAVALCIAVAVRRAPSPGSPRTRSSCRRAAERIGCRGRS